MTRALLALALCALATPAFADCGTIIQPPAQYRLPLNYEPTIRILPYFDVDAFCRAHGGIERGRYQACSFGTTIVLPALDPATQHCYFIHERAHREGWGADHPGGTYDR
jgi:hypothetical protein